ncbi:MAG TPA: hypothetical protein VK211_02685 [Kamptonema sp.]|nr:hypothetical protein [Kamptonema sp.]
MNIEVFFEKITIVDGKEEARVWDGTPLIFNCKEDPGLEAAMLLIQDRIDVKRYQQITPENPTP